MAHQVQAVAPAISAVAGAVEVLTGSEIEIIEQLGRDYWTAEDAKARAEKSLASCDVALFDLVKGRDYVAFMAVRSHYVTGCRDKGAPSDEAAAKVWERAINRIVSSCNFERPKSQSKDAERMAKRREEQIAKFKDKSDAALEEARDELVAHGDVKSMKQATEIVRELERRLKPELDKAEAERRAILDKLVKRAKELAKAGTADADDKLMSALNALS